MPDFRRLRVPGGCFFFTVNLLERRGYALLTHRIDLLRESVRRVRRARHLATPLPGARDPRRRGLRHPHAFRSLQPREARPRRVVGGLAVFHRHIMRRTRAVPGELERRWGKRCGRW